MLITDNGVIIRIPSDQISVQSRYAGGVRVMKVDDATKVIGITVVEKQDNDAVEASAEEIVPEADTEEITEE